MQMRMKKRCGKKDRQANVRKSKNLVLRCLMWHEMCLEISFGVRKLPHFVFQICPIMPRMREFAIRSGKCMRDKLQSRRLCVFVMLNRYRAHVMAF